LFSHSIAGNIGADVLRRFTLTLDYRARTVTFEPNAAAGAPFLQDMTGMTIQQRVFGEFAIISIAAGTPAAEAGLQVGDAIVAINGRSVATMGVKDFDAKRFGGVPFSITAMRGRRRLTVRLFPRCLL
jgi:C-terminal processing protease CtpA/Prc